MTASRLLCGACLAASIALGCKRETNDPATQVAVAPPPPAYDNTAPCDATGQWAVCSVMYRLKRAGFDVARDTEPVKEKALAQPGMRLHLGEGTLAVFLYADTLNRGLDESHLDPKAFLTPEADWMPQKRTLFHSANMLVLMDVANGRTRERISDALRAGPPQPPARATLPKTTTGR